MCHSCDALASPTIFNGEEIHSEKSKYFINFLKVARKTPEGGRAYLEQVEEWFISALEDRTRVRGNVLG